MTSSRIDRILLGLGALLILVSSYQLFFKTAESGDGLALGKLTSTMSVVKTKSALSLDWRDALKGLEVSENQLIYTDNQSSAAIEFLEGGTLEVGENSLIKLRSGAKEQELDLSHGFIRARLEDKKPLKVQMNGEDFLVFGDGADVQINIQDKKGEIGVIQGNVKVEAAGVVENLDVSNALSIEGSAVNKKNIYFKATSPKQNEVIYRNLANGPVTFAWSPDEDAKIILSTKPSLVGGSTYEGRSGLSPALPDGLYYYRIESEKGTSLLNSFRVMEEKAPVILRPFTGQKVNVLSEKPTLLLQWKDEARETYLIEWFDGEAHSQTVKGSSLTLPIKQSGLLRWRLKIENSERPLARFSDWQDVDVALIAAPKTPTEISPHEVEFQTYEAPNETVDLSWKSDSVVELELVDPTGETLNKKINAQSEKYLATKNGGYRFRVRAVDNYLRTSEWSEWKTFVIEDLSNAKNPEGIQRIQLKKPDQSVTFNWNAGEGTVSVFELAKDAQFQKIVKKVEGQRDSVQVSIPEIGEFYWRSRQYLPDGTFSVSEPRRVIIEPIPAPDKPNKLPDLEVPIEVFPVKKVHFLKKIFDFIIPSAYAEEEVQGQARIVLPTEEEAKGYVVRIFKDEALTELVFEMELDRKEFVWKFARPGTYYWQYAVVDYWDRRSLFSDPAVLTIKGDLTPLPEKPRLLFPIRAQEVAQKKAVLRWTRSLHNTRYLVEVAEDRKFQNVLVNQEVNDYEYDLTSMKLTPKLYFWRVTAFNKKNREVKSNIGRFVVETPLERIVIVDQFAWKKKWRKRLSLTWTPSMDSYTFKDSGETGKIDGNALMGLALKGTMFFEKGALNGEIVRQSGQVFEKEEYLFQRILVDYVYTWNLNLNHKLGIGVALGQTSGQAYEINDLVVTAEAESAPSYGVVLRNYLSFSEKWEMQGRLQYLTGDISQMDLDAEAFRHQKNFFFVGGVGYSMRSYSTSKGEQTSLRVSIGIGKEF